MEDASDLLDYVEEHTDLDIIAITDHDHIRGAWRAREVWANRRYRFEIVTGIEITSIQGHVLALFVDEPIPSLIQLDEALEQVHAQGGICVIPHPMSWLTRSLDQKSILEITTRRSDALYFDAIETATASSAGRIWIGKATRLNREHLHLAEVGGSDSHFPAATGCAYTQFDGRTGDDLRSSILNRTTSSICDGYPGLAQIGVGPIVKQTSAAPLAASYRGYSAANEDRTCQPLRLVRPGRR
jgi:predicted metal-dependent phosphoesterase TrpH